MVASLMRPEQASRTHGLVAVYRYRFAKSRAACSCGWAGPRRYLLAGAEQDAWMHFAHALCELSIPLVIRVD